MSPNMCFRKKKRGFGRKFNWHCLQEVCLDFPADVGSPPLKCTPRTMASSSGTLVTGTMCTFILCN